MVAELLKSVKIRIEAEDQHPRDAGLDEEAASIKKTNTLSRSRNSNDSSMDDPQKSSRYSRKFGESAGFLLATQNNYKHTMKALKKHHNIQELPPLPPQSKKNLTRRSSERI